MQLFEEEGDFGSCDDEFLPQVKHRQSGVKLTSSVSTPVTLRLHTPRDPEFRVTANATDDAVGGSTGIVRKLSIGEIWGGQDCHCLRCSLLRLAERAHSWRTRMNTPQRSLVVVLLDLDNFGFYQFQRSVNVWRTNGRSSNVQRRKRQRESASQQEDTQATSSEHAEVVPPQVDFLVWGFFGALFQRHYKIDPREYLATLPRRSSQNSQASAPCATTIWEFLKAENLVQLTPCGAHSQAVDEAIMQVVRCADESFPLLVVTHDEHLAHTAMSVLHVEKRGAAIVVPQGKGQLPHVVAEMHAACRKFLARKKNSK